MFADIFYFGILILGCLSAVLACILIIAGLYKRAKATVIIGAVVLIVALACFGLVFRYYYIYLPSIKNKSTTYNFDRPILLNS